MKPLEEEGALIIVIDIYFEGFPGRSSINDVKLRKFIDI